jgi:Protein of unknown function (DUF2946)
MRRMSRKWGGCLALFALALQLILSFGHVHAEDLGLAAPAGGIASHAQASAKNDGSPSPRDDDAHDICAICIALSLSATSLLPVVTSLSLPVAYEWEWPANVQSAQVVFALKSYYQARAPPHA